MFDPVKNAPDQPHGRQALPLHCTVCGKSFSKSKQFVIHMKNHSLNKCDACTSGNFDCTCSTQLRKHLITHMDGNTYQCTICGNTFSTSKHLVIHMKNLSWNKCYACTSGNFKLTCSTQLRMHLINSLDGKPNHCAICRNTFNMTKHLVIHIKITL